MLRTPARRELVRLFRKQMQELNQFTKSRCVFGDDPMMLDLVGQIPLEEQDEDFLFLSKFTTSVAPFGYDTCGKKLNQLRINKQITKQETRAETGEVAHEEQGRSAVGGWWTIARPATTGGFQG